MSEEQIEISGDAVAPPSLETPPAVAPEASPTAGGDAPEPKKLSLRDQIKENFEAAKEPKIDKAGKAHDEKGKFASKQPVEAPAAPVATAPKKDVQPSEPSKAIGPPPGWSPESKALYATLPDPLKADILKREKEVSDGFKKYSDDAKKYQEIDQVLAPARPIYQQSGVKNDAEAISRLVQWETSLRTNPVAGLVNLARFLNVDLASIAQNSPGPSAGPDATLQQYFQPITQQIHSVQSELENIRAEKAASEISQFAKDKPHFDRVKAEMGKLMQAGLVNNLEDAYQRAIWSDPEIKAELIKKELDSKISLHQQEVQQRSQQARKAAVSPSTKAPSAAVMNGKEKAKGVRGSILAAVNELRENDRA